MFDKKKTCVQAGKNSRLKLHECASTMYVENKKNKEYVVLQIDRCDKLTGCKCDYGVYLDESKEKLLVELKGADIFHAAKQLEDTLIHYILRKVSNVKCFIISSNIPLSSTESQNLKMKFQNKNGVPLYIQKSGFQYFYT